MKKQANNNSVAAIPGIKRRQWTPQEDEKLFSFILTHGHGSWRALPLKAGLQRCGKSCRLRWKNYLNPDIKRGNFSLQEDQTIIQLHALLGNRWSAIAAQLPKRTDNEVKNYWNTHLKKLLTKKGYDPVTHKRLSSTTAVFAAVNDRKSLANLSHVAQWETVRLQAEARFARQDLSTEAGLAVVNNNGNHYEQNNGDVIMDERAREVLVLLKSVLGGGGQIIGHGVESFGDHQMSGCDQFGMDQRVTNYNTSYSVGDFSYQGLGEYYNDNEYGEVLDGLLLQHSGNGNGFEVGDANWSLDQCL